MKIGFMATLKPLAREPSFKLNVEEGVTVKQLCFIIAGREGKPFNDRFLDAETKLPKPDILIFLNKVEVGALEGLETRVNDGDEVVFLPTVHGG